MDVNVLIFILNIIFLHAKKFANGLFEILQVGAKLEKQRNLELQNRSHRTSGPCTPDDRMLENPESFLSDLTGRPDLCP